MNPDPTKDDLIKLIEFEIKGLEDFRREQGWMPWVLWAATGALLWQAAAQVANVGNWPAVLIYWAVLSLSMDLIRSLVLILGQSVNARPLKRAPRFFSSSEYWSASRPYMSFTCAKLLSAALLIYVSGTLVGPVRVIWAVLYLTSLVGWTVSLVSTVVDWPVLMGKTATWIGHIFAVIVSLAQFYALAIVYRQFWQAGIGGFGANEAKFALLLVGLTEIAGLLLAFKAADPLRVRLIQLRRSLALGELTLLEAKSRLEVIIYGAELTSVLRSRVEDCVAALDEFGSRIEPAERLLAELTTELHREVPAPEQGAMRARFLALGKDCKAVGKIMQRAQSSYTSFEMRAVMMIAQGVDGQSDLRTLRDEMKKQVSAAAAKNTALTKALNEIEAGLV